MTAKIGNFGDNDDEKQPDETLAEFYIRLRDGQIQPNTEQKFLSAWNKLQEYIQSEHPNKTVFDLGIQDVRDWYDYLQEEGLRQTSIETHARRVKKMLDDLRQMNRIDGTNTPFVDAYNQHQFNPIKKSKIEIPYSEMKESIANISHPRNLCIILILAKCGLRMSELINLDERDINIDHPISPVLDDHRSIIDNKPNTLYIDSSITEGRKHNGVGRSYSNKQKSTRIIPLDNETVQTLGWYLSMRPTPYSPANPIFLSNGGGGGHDVDAARFENRPQGGIGCRISKNLVQTVVRKFAKENGYYQPKQMEGVYPHYFRHWFTTIMRKRIDQDELPIGSVKDFVADLRGDTGGVGIGEDTIDGYTHNWESAFEGKSVSRSEIVRRNTPKFFG